MKKLIRKGKVAVLVSPGFGAGWSTWNNDPATKFDPDMARVCLDSKLTDEQREDKLTEIANEKYPEAYTGGLGTLVVEWVERGSRIRIHEYDGNETLEVLAADKWEVA